MYGETPHLASVDLNITTRCNLNCSFCSVEILRPSNKVSELSVAELGSLFDQFDEMRVQQVRIVGGEPFVRRDILDILALTERRNFKTAVLTNGTLLKPHHVEAMCSFGIEHVALSFDGPDADLHDASRNRPGTFSRALQAVELCRHAGLPLRMMVAVTSRNVAHLASLAQFAAGVGFDMINFILLGLNGALRTNPQNFPTYAAWSEAIVALTNFLEREKPSVLVSLLFPHEDNCPQELYRPLEAAGLADRVTTVWGYSLPEDPYEPHLSSICLAASDGISIMPNGDVFGCDLMQEMPEFCGGNIKRSSVREIFERSPVFAQLRDSPAVISHASFEANSATYACGQCRAGVRNLACSSHNGNLRSPPG